MVWIKRIFLGIIILIALVLVFLFTTGRGPLLKIVWDLTTGAPDLPFDAESQPASPPDYSDRANWAALPDMDDLADMTPEGISNRYAQGDSPVDVFFIHPTGFLKGSSWTFDMNPNTSSEENTKWMMANNASAYNGCCNVYAPRYRQASIFTYFGAEEATRDTVLAFAYEDVARAFDYYLEHYNGGRPFVLASHSQGTHHGIRLLREKIDGTPIAGKMVAAYLIGGGIEKSRFQGLKDVSLCDSPDQLSCAIHWDTFNVTSMEDHEESSVVCTNPLTWKLGGGLAGKDAHNGALPSSGEYHLSFAGSDAAREVEFKPFGKPLPNFTEAQCHGGRLYISDQSDNNFGRIGMMGGSYHGLDYPMFYMDIRDNAILRVNTFLEANKR